MYKYLLLFALAFAVVSCDNDDPEIENEEELISTLEYTLTPADGDVVTLVFRDLDGDGGNAPVITVEDLAANTAYTGAVTFTNESEDPAEDITEEVSEEDDEHQVFYRSTILDITTTDTDVDGNPLGLQSSLTTGEAGSGTLTITLVHEPDKSAEGVASGDISNAGGETDIQVTFDINVR